MRSCICWCLLVARRTQQTLQVSTRPTRRYRSTEADPLHPISTRSLTRRNIGTRSTPNRTRYKCHENLFNSDELQTVQFNTMVCIFVDRLPVHLNLPVYNAPSVSLRTPSGVKKRQCSLRDVAWTSYAHYWDHRGQFGSGLRICALRITSGWQDRTAWNGSLTCGQHARKV